MKKEVQLMDICMMKKSVKAHIQKHITLSEQALQLFNAVLNEYLLQKGSFYYNQEQMLDRSILL